MSWIRRSATPACNFSTVIVGAIVALGLGACSNVPADERPALTSGERESAERSSPHGSAEFTLSDGREFVGAFVVLVGPGERASFEFSGHSPDGHSLNGSYVLDPTALVRTQDDAGWVSYSPSSAWDWIYDNRGSFTIHDGVQPERHLIREFEYRRDADGRIAVRYVGVEMSRLNADTRTISEGSDLVVVVAGRSSGSCRAAGPDGTILEDPTGAENPLCAELLPDL